MDDVWFLDTFRITKLHLYLHHIVMKYIDVIEIYVVNCQTFCTLYIYSRLYMFWNFLRIFNISGYCSSISSLKNAITHKIWKTRWRSQKYYLRGSLLWTPQHSVTPYVFTIFVNIGLTFVHLIFFRVSVSFLISFWPIAVIATINSKIFMFAFFFLWKRCVEFSNGQSNQIFH